MRRLKLDASPLEFRLKTRELPRAFLSRSKDSRLALFLQMSLSSQTLKRRLCLSPSALAFLRLSFQTQKTLRRSPVGRGSLGGLFFFAATKSVSLQKAESGSLTPRLPYLRRFGNEKKQRRRGACALTRLAEVYRHRVASEALQRDGLERQKDPSKETREAAAP